MLIGNARFKAAALSFLLVAAFLLAPASAFADYRLDYSFQTDSFAASPVSSLGTAFITRAALGALGVEIAGSLSSLSPEDVVRAMWYGGGSTLPPAFTYAQNLLEYLTRQTIRIRPDSITIDGVEYSDIWLPHDAADKFRVNAFDFITNYSISSETNGTFVSGSGNVDGIPVFKFGDSDYRSQSYWFPESVGDYSTGSFNYGNFISSGSYKSFISQPASGYRNEVYGFNKRFVLVGSSYQSGIPTGFEGVITGGSNVARLGARNPVIDLTPFDFTWVSANIPSDPLPSSYGLRTRLPSTYVKDLPQILDPESETYSSDLASLISGLETSASEGTLIDPAFEDWDAPVPPASGTIADEPYSSLSGALSGISSFLNTISTSVSGIAESIISGDAGFFGNVVSALAAPFEPVFAIFRSGVGIWHYVVSWVGTISAPFSWSLSALGSAGSYFLSPIYAAAAAAVVLAVYKKFGR